MKIHVTIAFLMLLSSTFANADETDLKKPNVLFFLVDDLGYMIGALATKLKLIDKSIHK